ncbi:MAG: iron-sulfur cluster repair di-iron protein [Crocinitomicaceae bacterium]
MTSTKEKTIGEMVAEDYRTAAVFKSFGIDFCCKGNRTLDEVCASDNLSSIKVKDDLKRVVTAENTMTNNFQSWPIDLLTDYIEKTHHRYVEAKTPEIKAYLEKICRVHGANHPELFEIEKEFLASAGELAVHMKKEELMLFPYIRKMLKTTAAGEALLPPKFGTIQSYVETMMLEHTTEGERFRKIAELSNNYTPPVDACNTYKVTFALLKEFEEDLHLHIHLENNILFPKAIDLERKIHS